MVQAAVAPLETTCVNVTGSPGHISSGPVNWLSVPKETDVLAVPQEPQKLLT